MIELLITIAKLTDRAKFPFVHWDARQTDMPHSGICCWGRGGLSIAIWWYWILFLPLMIYSHKWSIPAYFWDPHYCSVSSSDPNRCPFHSSYQSWLLLFLRGFSFVLEFYKSTKNCCSNLLFKYLVVFSFFSVCVFIFAKDFLFTVFCLSSLCRLTRLLNHRLLKVVLTMCQANNWFSFSIERHLLVFFGCQWHSDVCLHFYICL